MFDIVDKTKDVFGNAFSSYYESIFAVDIEIPSIVSKIPAQDIFESFINEISHRDNFTIDYDSINSFHFDSKNNNEWNNAYEEFCAENKPDDEVTIRIHIDKKFYHNAISIYSYDKFLGKQKSRLTNDILETFSKLLSDHPYVNFIVLDKQLKLFTNSIGFCTENDLVHNYYSDRTKWLNKCENISLFLNRVTTPLTPLDFQIIHKTGDTSSIEQLFGKIETLLSLLHLANSSYIINDKAVLQFSPTNSGLSYSLSDLFDNRTICNIFYWAFDNQNTVETFGIARNVINSNCHTIIELASINDTTLSSIKSNYMLYQSKTIDQYIELKNSISDYIVESSNRIHEILYGLLDGFKNNFIAVIMFLITVILTDSLNFEDFIATGKIDNDLKTVIFIFLCASTAYLAVSIITFIIKWLQNKADFMRLKNNYSDILDENDLNKAFQNYEVIKSIKMRVIVPAFIIGVIWAIFIIVASIWLSNQY